MATGTLTGRLVDHVLAVRYETLPAAAVEMASDLARASCTIMTPTFSQV